jgi:hypothetical protein
MTPGEKTAALEHAARTLAAAIRDAYFPGAYVRVGITERDNPAGYGRPDWQNSMLVLRDGYTVRCIRREDVPRAQVPSEVWEKLHPDTYEGHLDILLHAPSAWVDAVAYEAHRERTGVLVVVAELADKIADAGVMQELGRFSDAGKPAALRGKKAHARKTVPVPAGRPVLDEDGEADEEVHDATYDAVPKREK